MRNLFFYDTETSGLPDFRAPSSGEKQPHIVQFAAALVDEDTREVIASIDLVAKPDGWTIPDVAKVKESPAGFGESFDVALADLQANKTAGATP